MIKAILKSVLTGASVATAVMLVLVAYSDRFHPLDHPLLACLGMVFPIFLLANLLMLIIWLIVKWRRAWIPIVAYLLALPAIRVYFPLHFHQDPPEGCLKVLTYNVDCYNIVRKDGQDHSAIYDYLKRQDADIVCLQEDATSDSRVPADYSSLYPYNDTVHLGRVQKPAFNAMGIHSRFPILRKEVIAYESRGNGSVAFFLLMGRDTLLVINNHLESTHLSNDDRKRYTDMINGGMNREKAQAETRLLYGKLSKAMGVRARQAEAVHDYIERHRSYPMVVCGDFNDTPISYTRHTVSQGLTDCFVESGCGLGVSYKTKGFRFRIDNILCSGHFEPYNCYVDDGIEASDHYPVVCWLKQKP